jgi:serine/threonine protein kinase
MPNIQHNVLRTLAPEILESNYSTKADVFSLGLTVLAAICDIELPKNGELWHKVRILLQSCLNRGRVPAHRHFSSETATPSRTGVISQSQSSAPT